MQVSHVFGLAGTIMVVGAYLPQLIHLQRERCSAGLSHGAYVLWFVASLLILVHAIVQRDLVFIVLQGVNAIATGTILVLTGWYKDNICATHLHRFAPRQRAVKPISPHDPSRLPDVGPDRLRVQILG